MRYQFGDFELATERYELRRNGIALHVEPLVFDLILFLLRSPGRVVSREEIVDGVWQGRLVSEATIDGCIKSARRILGDSGDNVKDSIGNDPAVNPDGSIIYGPERYR